MSMNKVILPALALLVLLFIVAGYSGTTDETSESTLTTIADAQQLNAAISEGPVLVEIGANSCPACKAQKPILVEIADEYDGRASVLYLDSDRTRTLALSFNVYTIPDMFVIVEKTEQGYLYMAEDGTVTYDRTQARFIGLTAKERLTNVLDAAIEYRQ